MLDDASILDLLNKVYAARRKDAWSHVLFCAIGWLFGLSEVDLTKTQIMVHISFGLFTIYKYLTEDGPTDMQRFVFLVEGLPSLVNASILSLSSGSWWL